MVSKDVTVCNAHEFVTSPDGAVTVTVGVKSKQAFYMVSYQGKEVVCPSRLGFVLFSLMVRLEPVRVWAP